MATFHKTLDVYQGYNYKKDVQTPVGFMTELTIADQTLTADQTCKDPTAPETDLPVVAVLSEALWQLGVTDPLQFSGQVSTANKQKIQTLLFKTLVSVKVKCKFAIYDYDPLKDVYFKCMLGTSDVEVKGLLQKNGDDLDFTVADDPSREVQSPENYAFSIGIVPEPTAQTITIATGQTESIVKAWGLTVT